MKTQVIVLILLVFLLNIFSSSDACGGGGGDRGGGRSSSKSSRKSSGFRYEKTNRGKKVTGFGQTVIVGKGGIRDRDKTGHRTGLGTIAKGLLKNPKETIKAIGAFRNSYNEMRSKNIKGGNIPAHEAANRKATKIAGSKMASGISAFREQYKNFRAKTNPDGTFRIGDTRTKQEIKDTMDANQRGREQAMKSQNNGRK